MVLSCVVYGLEEDAFQSLMAQLNAMSKQTETLFRMELYTQRMRDALRALEEMEGIALWVIGVGDIHDEAGRMAMRLAQSVMQRNRDHYIVYVAKDRAAMERISPFCVRPAGLVTIGALEKGGEVLFGSIMRDYHGLYAAQAKPETGWLHLKSQGTVNRVHLDDVCLIQALNKKVEVRTPSQVVTVYDSLENMAEQLDQRFVRCHRSYFINKEKIQYVDFRNFCIRLMDGSSVPFSRSFRRAMMGVVDKADPEAEAAPQGS